MILNVAAKLEYRLLGKVQSQSGNFPAYAQSVPGTLSHRQRRPGREANHSPSSSAETENAWSYNFTPTNPYAFMPCVETTVPLLVTL